MLSISFIVPVYNGEKYIERCLRSILCLDGISGELIVINDGSTDNSMDIVDSTIISYNTNNFNIIVESQSNSGVAYTRNRGIHLATKEYVSFVDQDDYLLPGFTKQFQDYCNMDYDMIIGGFCRKDENGKLIKEFVPTEDEFSKYCLTYPWGRIIRKDFLIQTGVAFLKTGIGEDVYFDLVAYSYTKKIKMIRDYSYVWFMNTESVSNTNYVYINKKTDPVITFDKILEDMSVDFTDDFRYVEYYFIKFIVWFLLSNAKKSDYSALLQERDRLFSWLVKHFPQFSKNPSLGLFKPKGDSLFNRLSVSIYIKLYKLNLDKLLLRLL